MPENEQVKILRLIWGEMKALNQRVDGVRDELAAVRTELKVEIAAVRNEVALVREELKGDVDALRHRMTESEVRVATAVTDLSGETRQLASLIREWREEHRSDRSDLRERVRRIEAHLGLSH